MLLQSEEGVSDNALIFCSGKKKKTCVIANESVPVKIYISSPDFINIWSTLGLLINIINSKMCQTMKVFGFPESGGFLHSDVISPPLKLQSYEKKSLSIVPQIFNIMELKED